MKCGVNRAINTNPPKGHIGFGFIFEFRLFRVPALNVWNAILKGINEPSGLTQSVRPYGCRTLLRSGTATPKSPKVSHLHATRRNRLETEV